MTSILSTGTSALLAFQRALTTVGHNVSNVATPGYSRQRVDLEARPGVGAGQLQFGGGVDVAKLQRLADSLVFGRQLDSSGEVGRLEQVSTLSGRVDALLSDPASGLARPWAAFFTAAEGVTAEPTSPIARAQLLNSAEQLAGRWRTIDAEMGRIEDDVDNRIVTRVADTNRIASEVADLNRDIIAGGANPSPDLLDERAVRIDQLAKLVGASVVQQDDGALNVFTAGGQPLVLGNKSMGLSTIQDPFRPDRLQIALAGPSGSVQLPSGAVSGEVGGLLEFRGRVLDPARAELGRLATVFAGTFNATQNAGVDYNGDPGADVFALPPPRVYGHGANTGSATLTASVGDLGALKAPDLVLRFDGGAWAASRADTGAAVPITGAGTSANPLRVAGVNLTLSGTAAAGDRFALSPTSGAASDMQVVMRDAAGIAAATPLQAGSDVGNLGTGRVASARVTDASAFSGFAGSRIDFIDATSYTVDGGAPVTWTPGTPITGPGWSVSVEGAPAAGDGFSLSPTPPRSADNANMRELAALDERRVLDGGTSSMTLGLSQITARVGSQTRHAELTLEAQQSIHSQVVAERESVSGVNLDEEAANLLRFQQAYQAAAQIIATADTLFQSLLGAVRR